MDMTGKAAPSRFVKTDSQALVPAWAVEALGVVSVAVVVSAVVEALADAVDLVEDSEEVSAEATAALPVDLDLRAALQCLPTRSPILPPPGVKRVM